MFPRVILSLTLCVLVLLSAHSVASELSVEFTDSEKALLSAFTPWPTAIPADSGNEYSGIRWAEVLGEKLFNDPVLSGNQTISCSSCHLSALGFAESTALAEAGMRPHVRNTQGLLNVAYQRWFGWDGGADSLWSASLRPLLSNIEMGANIDDLATRLRNIDYLADAMQSADVDIRNLGDKNLVVSVSKFIGAYMRTLVSGQTDFDRYLSSLLNEAGEPSAYSASAKRGMKLFFGEGNCFACHFGENFSNGEFHDIGRPFFTGVGKVDPGRYNGIQRIKKDPFSLNGAFNGTHVESEILKTTTVKSGQINFGQWRTPSLRNLLLTAPYMHDGSLSTLREVVDYYADIDPARLHTKGEAILRPLNWSDSERNDLVEFLTTLTE